MTAGTPGTYTFLPWLRRGAASAIPEVEDLDPAAASRATLPVELTVNTRTVDIDARIYGPGDVIGLEARQIARTEPQADSQDFPPTYFAAVDLVQEDLPWLFTPLRANARGRLRPWIVLITVRKQPGVRLRHRANAPLPVLEIEPPAVPRDELPDLAESWAWAHVQVSGTPPAGQSLIDYLEQAPHLGVARLVSPQRLQPNSNYFACIVPAFHAGVQAGLGIEQGVPDLDPAWEHGPNAPGSIHIPIYYHFEFGTADRKTDFESLAEAIKPRAVGPNVGQRPMDVGAPGPGLPEIPEDAPGRILALEGPLRSPETETQAWPDSARLPFEERVRELLDPPDAESLDPVIGPILAPPLYGRWHALQERVPAAQPHWFRELNLDPRYRASAGLGTRVVQQDQEDLIEEAWAQVDDIVRVNLERKRAQLARAVLAAMKAKHLDPLPADHLTHLTRPMHKRLLMSPRTLHSAIEGSSLPPVALSGALRRFARPRGALARRLMPGQHFRWRSIPGRMNADEIQPAGPRQNPDGTTDLDRVSDSTGPNLPAPLGSRLTLWLLLLLSLLLLGLAVVALAQGLWSLWLAFSLPAIVGLAGSYRLRQLQAEARRVDKMRTAQLTPDALRTAAPRPEFRLVSSPDELLPPTPTPTPGATDSSEARLFRGTAVDALDHAQDMVLERPRFARKPLEFGSLAQRISERLNPEVTIADRMRASADLPPSLWEPEDPIEPVMVYPEFPRPMYEAVAELSEDFIIPGLEHIPPNTATLLETNPPVIQAIMVGLNHEMSRELLWREFPTDQRGSYFRQFWDPSGRVPPPQTEAEREALLDIPELHRWQAEEHLGQSLAGDGSKRQLVLVIRGELLRRFPSAMIFAEHAARDEEDGMLKPDGTVRDPLFRGRLLPDVHFLGFDLTEEDARGSDEADEDRGWYFVIMQQATEPRFGLDEVEEFADTLSSQLTTWGELTWGHLATEDDFPSLTYVSVTGPLPDTSQVIDPEGVSISWGENAAHMAFITLQKPVRIAIHARLMLPQVEAEDNDD